MRILLIILTAFLFFAANGQEQLQIRETFANNSGSYQTGTNSTYDIYFGVATGSTGSNPGGAMVAPYTGVTSMDSTPVNVTYTTITEKGFLQDAHSSDRKFFYTTSNSGKYINQNPISRTGQELSRVKYATANNSTTWVTRFCVLVAGKWYAYGGTGQQQTVVSGNSDGSAFSTYTAVWDVAFNMSGANWCPVTYDPDLNLSVDTVNRVTLPAGDVNGYGLYCSRTTASTAQIRFDNIEIYTVPVAQAGTSLAVRETFYNTTGGYRSGATHGWALRQGTTDTLPHSNAINPPYLGSVLTDNTPVGVDYSTVSDSGFISSAESNTIKLFYTNKNVSIQRSTQDLSVIRWVSANSSTGWAMRPVIRIDTVWYAYGPGVSQDLANSGSDGSAFSSANASKTYYWNVNLNMTNGQWYPLTHTANVSLSISTSGQNLPLGDVTGYGLLFTRLTNSAAYTRFDTYEIYTSSGAPVSTTHKVRVIQ